MVNRSWKRGGFGAFDCKLNLINLFLPSSLLLLPSSLSFSSFAHSFFFLSFESLSNFKCKICSLLLLYFLFWYRFWSKFLDQRFWFRSSKKRKMKKSCELCKRTARIRCESDQASLCWDCDAKVHSANFLVARHSRNLLCRVCQSPTAWSAAGSKLEQTYSDCRKCAARTGCEEDEVKPVKEEVDEIHVLPWSPPPPAESSVSGGEAFHGGEAAVARKRRRLHNNDRPALV